MDGDPPVGPLGPMPLNVWQLLEPDPTGPCWTWTGATCSKGRYGVVYHEGKRWMIHRLIYHTMIRPLKPGEDVHHRRPPCQRGSGLCGKPSHLMAMDEDAHDQLHARPLPTWESELEIAAEVAARLVRAQLASARSREY